MPLVNFLSGKRVEEDVNRAVQALAVVVGTLGATGILATAALGTSCQDAVEWEGVLYISPGTVREAPERGASLGSGEIHDCEAGGRCSPPGESVQVFRLEDVDPSVAVATNTDVYLAPGTFPALPDHPLHEAVFGSSSNPNYRKRCGEPFGFVGEVKEAGFSVRVAPNDPPDQLLDFVDDDGLIWLEVDADTVVEGFDRNGVATIEVELRSRSPLECARAKSRGRSRTGSRRFSDGAGLAVTSERLGTFSPGDSTRRGLRAGGGGGCPRSQDARPG